MPATGATHLIFFIAAIFIAATLVAAFTTVIYDLNDAMEDRGRSESMSVKARVEVINDLVAMPYNNTSKTLDIYVKNVGATKLWPNQTLVLIDGLDHNHTYRFVGGATEWNPGMTAVFTVEDCYFTANSDHFLKVVCSYGAADTKEFRIGALP